MTDFYQEKLESPIFPTLVSFLTKDPILAFVVEKATLFADIAALVGPANPSDAQDKASYNTLRAIYGSSELKNAIHYESDT